MKRHNLSNNEFVEPEGALKDDLLLKNRRICSEGEDG